MNRPPLRESRHEFEANPAVGPGQGAADPAEDAHGRNAVEHLCRWAFCLSLRQPVPPTPVEVPADSNVEMSWAVFGGDAQELYLALLKERCEADGLGTSEEVLARQFRLHLHRGIGYLATPHLIRSIADLLRLAGEGNDIPPTQ